MLKVDLHVHTLFSPDASTTFEQLTARCIELGIGAIAIADHGTIDGALEYIKTEPPVKVIIAEEILTPHGEIMGMFLRETIPSISSVEDTVKAIRDQGGIVCIPHPFDPVRSSALDNQTLKDLTERHQVDVLEVLNARYVFSSSISQAKAFAAGNHLLQSAGSDSHSVDELGSVYLQMPRFNTKSEFLHSLSKAAIHGRNRSPLVHLGTVARNLKNKLAKQ